MRTATRFLLLLIDLASSGLHPSLGEIRVANDLTSLCLKKPRFYYACCEQCLQILSFLMPG